MSSEVGLYVHDPKDVGGPNIAVVLRSNADPVVALRASYAEAGREPGSKLAALKQTTLSHESHANGNNEQYAKLVAAVER